MAIGRNEGERLRRCFDALPAAVRHVVYVDSKSTDGSVELARLRGIDVVALDLTMPFTASRARNAGIRRIRELWPELLYVQVIDGDCSLASGWLDAAMAELEANPRLAIVCGRRREIDPRRSIYNRLCDMEWDTPSGDVAACGGDALVRMAAVLEVGGFDERVLSGEEPELCARLRARGWRIRRIAREMTLHDAAMTRFSQWWTREVRSGHGFAQVGGMHSSVFRRQRWSSVAWGLVLPAVTVVCISLTGWLGLLPVLAYPALWLRIYAGRRSRGSASRDAALYATFRLIGKFPELVGMVKHLWNRGRGRPTPLIEYK